MAKREYLDYKKAGHDLDRSDAIIERLRGRLPDIGGFGACFELPPGKWRRPVLVSGTDGVGTKLLVAIEMNKHDTVGIDLVAMVVNDILVTGAQPLFFLDYIAAGVLEPDTIEALVAGVIEGCEQARCRLVGGETAEMAGMYAPGHYDMAGFGVGVVEKARAVDGGGIRPGDAVIGLASSGIHSNGYTLARAVFERNGISLKRKQAAFGRKAGLELLEPTRIYVPLVLDLLKRYDLRGMAHITGGGLPGNLNRCLPAGCDARIDCGAWERPAIFDFLAEHGPVEEAEMFRSFNMGIGFCLVLPEAEAPKVLRACRRRGQAAWRIGSIEPGEGRVRLE